MERDQGQLRKAQRPGKPAGDAAQAEERSEESRRGKIIASAVAIEKA